MKFLMRHRLIVSGLCLLAVMVYGVVLLTASHDVSAGLGIGLILVIMAVSIGLEAADHHESRERRRDRG